MTSQTTSAIIIATSTHQNGVRAVTGVVFDIQRFSVHDGPGIRTTVFMKGCPLRCRWCHNPEGLSPELQLKFLAEQCIGCGACGKRELLSDADACPAEALTVCGWEAHEEEIISLVLRDRMFYADNGGITFSGGECLLQADFCAAVLTRAKSLGLHTAIDTCGYVSWGEIQKTLDCCDLYLYDIKCLDPTVHKEYTGVSNSLILENLKRLSQGNKDIWIRIPVIPDFNNSEREMNDIANFISSLKTIKQVTLMPYHSLGAGKYKALGLTYPYDSTKKISSEELARYRKIFENKKIPLA